MDFVKSAIAQVTNRGPQHGAAAQDNKAKESQPMAEVEDDSPKPDRNKKIRPKKIGGKDADAAKEPSDTREQ